MTFTSNYDIIQYTQCADYCNILIIMHLMYNAGRF